LSWHLTIPVPARHISEDLLEDYRSITKMVHGDLVSWAEIQQAPDSKRKLDPAIGIDIGNQTQLSKTSSTPVYKKFILR
jgi:hypothetical protein